MKRTLKERINNGSYADSILNYDTKRWEQICFAGVYKTDSFDHVREKAEADRKTNNFNPPTTEGEYYKHYLRNFHKEYLLRLASAALKLFGKVQM